MKTSEVLVLASCSFMDSLEWKSYLHLDNHNIPAAAKRTINILTFIILNLVFTSNGFFQSFQLSYLVLH